MDTPETSIGMITELFPRLTPLQQQQLSRLYDLYQDWNAKINVISRRDIDYLYLRHVLHSMAIARYISFKPGTSILDIGTGGGFPGIPLAICFPECRFTLIDSIGKKIRVAAAVAHDIGLTNTLAVQRNAKEEKGKYDFIVSRAVMNARQLADMVRKNIASRQHNALPNGLICLKGGNLDEELSQLGCPYELVAISDYFKDPFFETKQILYVPLS